jgi:cell division protein FtsQ
MSSSLPSLSNRAESLRSRRGKTPGERKPRATQSARKPVKSSPVMVRNVSAPVRRTTTVASRTTQRAPRQRRQFYASLGASGAELRLPALPVVRPGWRLISGMLTILFSLALVMLLSDPRFTISRIDIVGLQRLNATDVEAVMDLYNRSIITVQPAEVEAAVAAAFPELADVQVTVAFPASIGVSATERQPAISWRMGDQTIWVDAEGVVIPARGEPAEPLLAIQANSRPPLLPAPKVEDASEEATPSGKPLKAIDPNTLPIWGRQVDPNFLSAVNQLRPYVPPDSVIAYNLTNGLGWSDPRGWQVFIGLTVEDIDLKLVEYHAVVETLSQQGIQPRLISVEHVHAPFYRMEQ